MAEPILTPTAIEQRVWGLLLAGKEHSHTLGTNHPVLQSWLRLFRKGRFLGLPVGQMYGATVEGHLCECYVFTAGVAAMDSTTQHVSWMLPQGKLP